MRSNNSSLVVMNPYSRIGPASSRAATLRRETAVRPPSSASATAAATIRSRSSGTGRFDGSGRSHTVMITPY
ncbi:hypothetical protein STENM223S_02101 [Streptomyces tendae]